MTEKDTRLQRHEGTQRRIAAAKRAKWISPARNGVAVIAVRAAWIFLLVVLTGATAWADDLADRMSDYRRKLAAYTEARAAYDAIADPYWAAVSQKRKLRIAKQRRGERPEAGDYVLQQAPLYSGPPRPQNPENPRADSGYIPVVADFLEQAKAHFDFTPERPATDDEYRRAYAREALAAGLTAEQCVKVYAFESGGDGGYAVQAGLEYDRPGARAISTALGYNQLLTTNSVELLAEVGDQILASLRSKARNAEGARREQLDKKIATLKKMIAFTRTVPDSWSAHSRLAATDKGLAIHALILDVDVGPLLQVHKLLTSVTYAKRKGYSAPLTAAELEMMNLTGDGTGFDMVTMPDDLRKKVPTSNFFQKGGYERNPVAIRNNTVEKLLAATDAKMEEEAQLGGARALAAAFRELD